MPDAHSIASVALNSTWEASLGQSATRCPRPPQKAQPFCPLARASSSISSIGSCRACTTQPHPCATVATAVLCHTACHSGQMLRPEQEWTRPVPAHASAEAASVCQMMHPGQQNAHMLASAPAPATARHTHLLITWLRKP